MAKRKPPDRMLDGLSEDDFIKCVRICPTSLTEVTHSLNNKITKAILRCGTLRGKEGAELVAAVTLLEKDIMDINEVLTRIPHIVRECARDDASMLCPNPKADSP